VSVTPEDSWLTDACDQCGHLVRHHWDHGCGRCPCKISNAELEYLAILAEGEAAP
jgi:hypothetical protein